MLVRLIRILFWLVFLQPDGSGRRASQKRPDLKMTISKDLLHRLEAAGDVMRYVEAASQRAGRSAGDGGGRGPGGSGTPGSRGMGGGRGRRWALASAADDDYPTNTIRHRGNRRRIDPRVALNHIFECVFKVSRSLPAKCIGSI